MRGACLGVLVGLAMGMLANGEAVKIEVGPLNRAENLLRNPGFEQGSEQPSDWAFWASEPWHFSARKQPKGGRDGACFTLDEKVSTVMSAGMLGQDVSVKSKTRYRVGAWTRLRGGCAVIYLSRADGRCEQVASRTSWRNSDLQPDFLGVDETASPDPDQWFWLGAEFTTDEEETKISVQIACFGERTSVDYDDAYLGVAEPGVQLDVVGKNIQAIAVEGEQGETIWDGGGRLIGGVFSQTFKDLPAAGPVKVVVQLADGEIITRRYPQ